MSVSILTGATVLGIWLGVTAPDRSPVVPVAPTASAIAPVPPAPAAPDTSP